MSLLIKLYLEFFKIGLFAVGGGLATIPFLHDLIGKYHWFDAAMLSNMIAISESTPGPIGVNMATFTGYTVAGITGGVIATLGLITPSIIIIVLIAQILEKFKESQIVQAVFKGLRPAVAGLIAAAGFDIFLVTMFNQKMPGINYFAVAMFGIILFLSRKYKKHPIFYISICAVIGVIFKL